MLKPIAILSLMLAACAETGGAANTPAPVACTIPETGLLGADEFYDVSRSTQLLEALDAAALADRDAFVAGATQQLGRKLADVTQGVGGQIYVARPAAQLAVRLRQLDCAVQRGLYQSKRDTAQRLFQQIAAEIGAARQRLAQQRG